MTESDRLGHVRLRASAKASLKAAQKRCTSTKVLAVCDGMHWNASAKKVDYWQLLAAAKQRGNAWHMPQSSNNLGLFQQLCNQERSLVEWSRCNSDDVRLSVVNNLVGLEHLGGLQVHQTVGA